VSDPIPPIPAATLVLMRAGDDAPELLVMERAAGMTFVPGAIVFPGGRVDPDDYLLAERIAPGLDHAAARIAAIRETIEEVGIAAGLRADAVLIHRLRETMRGGENFSLLVERLGLELDLEALTPFANWCPSFNPVRRFDTWFFIAEPSGDTNLPETDQSEAAHSFWASARHILDEADSGRLKIIFPTRRNLERIAQYTCIAEARADAAAFPVQRVEPRIEQRDGHRWLCIPEGIGYPVTAERMDLARRFPEDS